MSVKKFTRQWTNGKISFPSIYGVKNEFAWDLIHMKDIEVPEKDLVKALKSPAKYLESHGWFWKHYDDIGAR